MGIVISKCYTRQYDTPMQLGARIQILEGEISRLSLIRESETREFRSKEEEWKRERRGLKEETARLRTKVKDDEERMRELELEVVASRESECKDWQHWLGAECLVERMKEEQAQREATVDKWKQLYLTIKNELDDLILRTKQGARFGLGVEEGLIEGLQAEVMAKEETIEVLRSKVAAMEKERIKKEREIDILRQSLRILNCSKRSGRRNLQRRWL